MILEVGHLDSENAKKFQEVLQQHKNLEVVSIMSATYDNVMNKHSTSLPTFFIIITFSWTSFIFLDPTSIIKGYY